MTALKTPVKPNDKLAVLTWNIRGAPAAKEALVKALDAVDCPWSVVLVQEWGEPMAGAISLPSVRADLNLNRPRGWEPIVVTNYGQHKRRSVVLVRTTAPDASLGWPLSVVGQGSSETVCWVQVELAARIVGQPARRFFIANVHGTSRRTAGDDSTRLQLVNERQDELDELQKRDKKSPLIVGGDWNAEPWDAELHAHLGQGAARAVSELQRDGRLGRIARFHNPCWPLVPVHGKSNLAGTYFFTGERGRADRWKLFDYFILSEPAAALYGGGGRVELVPELSGHTTFSLSGAPKLVTSGADHIPVSLMIDDPCREPEPK